jgi:hypothetical protein
MELTLDDFQYDMAVNNTGVLAAAKRAVQGFDRLPSNVPKTFIFTGNILNLEPIVPIVSAGMGKAATAHLIATASLAYEDKGYR